MYLSIPAEIRRGVDSRQPSTDGDCCWSRAVALQFITNHPDHQGHNSHHQIVIIVELHQTTFVAGRSEDLNVGASSVVV